MHFPEKDYKKSFRISAYMKEKGVFQEIKLHCETSRWKKNLKKNLISAVLVLFAQNSKATFRESSMLYAVQININSLKLSILNKLRISIH